VALGLGAALGVVQTAGAATTPPEPPSSVTVLDPGDQTLTIQLPGLPAVGATGTRTTVATTTGSIVVTGSGGGTASIDVVTTIVADAEVLSVGADGYDVLRIVRSYDAVDNSVGADGSSYQADPELAGLVGLRLIASMGTHGSLLALVAEDGAAVTPDQQASIDDAFDSANRNGFPDVPLGVGARWTATLGSGPSAVIASYTLVSIDGDEYTIEAATKGSVEAIIDPNQLPTGFDDAAGSLTSNGRYTARLGEPFARSAVTTLTMELTMTGPANEATTNITRVTEETALPA